MTSTKAHQSESVLADIGKELAEARTGKDLSVADVSSVLRLTTAHIEAIERGDMATLPGATYAIGYVRGYAGVVGLNPDTMCHRLRASLEDEEVRPEYTFVGSRFPRYNGAGRMALAAVTAMMVGYGGWYAFDIGLVGQGGTAVSERQVEAVLSESDASRLATPGSGEALVEETADSAARTVRTTPGGPASGVSAGAQGPAPQQEVAGLDAGDVLAAPLQPAPADDPFTVEAGSPLQIGQAVAHNRNPTSEIVIKAVATSWVEISRPDGSVVSSWLMREGDEYIVPGDQDIYLTAGNAGGLEVEISGRPPRKLGEWGETVSELPLDPTLLPERY